MKGVWEFGQKREGDVTEHFLCFYILGRYKYITSYKIIAQFCKFVVRFNEKMHFKFLSLAENKHSKLCFY